MDDIVDERLSFEADAVFSGNLTISKLQISDSGKYKCSITTRIGIGIGVTQLKVKCLGKLFLSGRVLSIMESDDVQSFDFEVIPLA